MEHTTTNHTTELARLESERDRLTNKGYMMILETIPAIGIPAAAAAFLGDYLVKQYHAPQFVLAILLLAALWASWKFILSRMNTFNAKLRVIVTQIKVLKEKTLSSSDNQNSAEQK
jgi:hypothetical protein